MQSGQYYCTNELANELTRINNAVDHLKLDGNIMSTSDSFKRFYDPRNSVPEGVNPSSNLANAAGFIRDLKSKLHVNSLRDKQENQVRELHQWGVNNLRGIQQALDTSTYNAADRIRQFGDFVGVTDRYTGYRHNLTRGSREPVRMEPKWADRTRQTEYINTLNSTAPGQPFRRGPLPPPLCITESLQRPYRTESDSGAQCQPNATSEVTRPLTAYTHAATLSTSTQAPHTTAVCRP